MPNIKIEPADHQHVWSLYGDRIRIAAPYTAAVTSSPEDRDALDFRVLLTIDVTKGRLSCTALTVDNSGTEAITGDDLRRIPVASYVELAAKELGVLDSYELPAADFARQGMTDTALEDIARVHVAAQVTGQHPSGVLLSYYGMPRPTSSRWLAAARRRGVLVDEHRIVAALDGERS